MLNGVRKISILQRSTVALVLVAVLLLLAAVAAGARVGGSLLPAAGAGATTSAAGGFVVAAFAALFVISLALGGAIALSLRPVRRKKRGDDEPEWVHVHPPLSRLEKAVTTLLALLLIAVMVGAAIVVARRAAGSDFVSPAAPSVLATGGAAGAAVAPQPAAPARQDQGSAVMIGALAGAAVLVVTGVVLAVFFRRRRGAGTQESGPAPPSDVVAESLALSLDELEREPDPRRAIIAAYAHMERLLAAGGMARVASETALEFLYRVLRGAAAPERPCRDLTALFQEALFSRHDLTAGDRDRACRALVEIRRAVAE